MLQFSIALFGLGVLALAVFDMVQGFIASGGTFADRFKGAFRHSMTVFWSQLSLIALGAPVVAGEFSDYLGDPAVMQSVLAIVPPEVAHYLPAAVALLALLARRRTAK